MSRRATWPIESRAALSQSLTPSDQLGPADQGSVRRHNVSLVLRYLYERGAASRASVAAGTGLTKATVSNLVPDLLARRLLQGGGKDPRSGAGRPGEKLRLAEGTVAALGVELNVGWIYAVAFDVSGKVVYEATADHDGRHVGAEATMDALAFTANGALEAFRQDGLEVAGVTVAVPGSVDLITGVVSWSPYIGWHNVDLHSGLMSRLTAAPPLVRVDSVRNLALLAECWAGTAGAADDVVYLNGSVGVGAGVLVGRNVLRGTQGMGGEIGHMPLNPTGPRCGCGRRGCWETVVGLPALVREAKLGRLWADIVSVSNPIPVLEEITRRADAGDKAVTAALEEVASWLGIGASVIVNIVNPDVIVLGGYFAALEEYLLPGVVAEIRRHTAGTRQRGCTVVAGCLGLRAAAHGGAEMVRRALLADPGLVDIAPADEPAGREKSK